jgi:hypothetical protein
VAPVPDEADLGETLGTPVEEVPPALATKKRALRQVQAATADPEVRLPQEKRGIETQAGPKAPIKGKYFRLSDSIGLMPLMEWAASNEEVDARSANQLLGFYRVLQDLVHADDWLAFKKHTRESKCTDEDFIAFQNAAMEVLSARPTRQPATS